MSDHKQNAAIAFGDGPALVLAGPGAGKTYVLTHRLVHMVKKRHIPPSRILVITFTKAAASEMRDRYLSLSKDYSQVTFGTFHSFFLSVLREELHFTKEDILDAKMKRFLLQKTAEELSLSIDRIGDFYTNVEKEIGFVKNAGFLPEEFCARDLSQKEFAMFFSRYERAKDDYGRIDFDDMLLKAGRLFRRDPAVLAKWRERFSYFLVDEAQDMNGIQYDLIRLLAAPRDNLFFVGDDDQSIYGFRAADPGWMLDFKKDYPSGTVIVLDRNYRSAPEVVGVAKRLIAHNEKRIEKNYAAARMDAGKVRFLSCADEGKEAETVCAMIYEEQKRHPDKSIAILFRNHAQSAAVIDALKKKALSYRCQKQQENPYDHFVYRDVRDYFSLACGSKSRGRLLHVMNRPERFLPRAGLEEAEVSFEDWKAYHGDAYVTVRLICDFEKKIEMLSGLSSFAALNMILKGMGYEAFAREEERKGQMKAGENSRVAEILSLLSELARRYPGKKDFLTELRRLRDGWKAAEGETPGSEGSIMAERSGLVGGRTAEGSGTKTAASIPPIRLLSFHGSKGLEFDHVYILDACEGITPSKRAKTPEAIEEERRMFYVAVTRAKTDLTLLFIERRRNETMYASRFLKEMAEE